MSDRKLAWVTGGGGGIGGATTRLLAAAGWEVVISGREIRRLEDTAATLDSVHPLVADATRPEDLKAAHEQILADFGRLDAVVHAVGSVALRSVQATSVELFRETLDINLTSAFALLQCVAPGMARRDGGRIVLFSSVAAGYGLPNHAAIAAAKAGVEGLTRAAAADFARKGVRINAIAPALTETPLTAPLLRSEAGREASAAMHPVGRYGRAEEVASVAAWLVDGAPDWMTGDVLRVDGGLGALQAMARR